MALAPRQAPAERQRKQANTAEGKAKQRTVRKEARTDNLGSSGTAKGIGKYPSLDWSTLPQDQLVHVSDFEGKITQAQMTSFGYFSMGMHLPVAAAHAALDAALASQTGMVYIRVYNVPMELYVAKMAEIQAEEEARLEQEHADAAT